MWAAALAAASAAALGAEEAENPTSSEISLTRLVVTGSNLRGSPASSRPLTVLDRGDFERTGLATNLLEILQKRFPAFSGSGNLGTTNANAGASATIGGSQASLYNLSTLVLIDGRRVADNGSGGKGGRSFVDLSQIPVAAIERVEILAGGASPIYGADAIGGVVNVILRSDFHGVETGARYAFSPDDGGYTERTVYAIGGAGDDRLRATVAVNGSKSDPLFQSDRAFSRPLTGRTATVSGAIGQDAAFPAFALDPALASPRERNPTRAAAAASSLAELVANGTYRPASADDVSAALDVSPYYTLILGRENRSAYVTLDAKLAGGRIDAFGDALLARNDTQSQVIAQSTTPTITVPAGAPFNPLTTDFPQVAFRYLPAPRTLDNRSDLDRFSGGVRGELTGDWQWQADATYSREATTQRARNGLYAPNFARAIAGGYDAQGQPVAGGAYSRVRIGYSESGDAWTIQPALDPFARAAAVDPASLANVLGPIEGRFAATLTQVDAMVNGSALLLPAGKIRFALGIDLRRETLAGEPDENLRATGPTARRWIGAPYFDPFTRSRRIGSGFAEASIPLAGRGWTAPGLRALDLDVAFRSEDYSDAGRSEVPKFGLRWQPAGRNFTVRAAYAKSFQAPTLYALFGPVAQTFTSTATIPGVFGVSGQAQQLTGSNSLLRPSTAWTRSLGFTWAAPAFEGLAVGADFSAIEQSDLGGTLGAAAILQDVDAHGAASPFARQVAFFNFPGLPGAAAVTRPGQLREWLVMQRNAATSVFVVDTQRNLAGQRVRAFDVHAAYRRQTDTGAWELETTGTFFNSFRFQATPLEPFYEYAGTATRGGTGSQGTIPRERFYTTATWRRAAWHATLGHTYVSSVIDSATGGSTFAAALAGGTRRRVPVEAFSAFDAMVGWEAPARAGARRRWCDGLSVSLGVNNFANRRPSLAPQAFDDNNADIATYDPIGRLWHVRAGVTF